LRCDVELARTLQSAYPKRRLLDQEILEILQESYYVVPGGQRAVRFAGSGTAGRLILSIECGILKDQNGGLAKMNLTFLRRYRPLAVLVLLGPAQTACGGLYYSGERLAELPSQWRGFLLDQRSLRMIAVKPAAGTPVNLLRAEYERAAARLVQLRKERGLTAIEQADLGALYVRLGELPQALNVLESAKSEFPGDFRIAANLGTAWLVQGEAKRAALLSEQAVQLAPPARKPAEALQLRLARLRQHQPANSRELDALFGIHFVDEDGQYRPGSVAAGERKKLPADGIAIVQQLALWLPADGRLLWQLGELAGVHGDVKTAAAIMDGCVTEFGMHSAELIEHRRLMRAAADELVKSGPALAATSKAIHERHVVAFRPRSKRPLESKVDPKKLPPIRPREVNTLPWAVLAETTVDKPFSPVFSPYLKELNGKQVEQSGFMQPIGDNAEPSDFILIENPVGCWYCEMPELTGLVHVQLPGGETTPWRRSLVRVVGELALNEVDPENFLYTIRKAKVSEAD
jgi:hypothetical protein